MYICIYVYVCMCVYVCVCVYVCARARVCTLCFIISFSLAHVKSHSEYSHYSFYFVIRIYISHVSNTIMVVIHVWKY